MSEKIIKWNNQLLSWNDSYIRTETVAPAATYPTDGLIARYDFNDNLTDSINSYNLTSSIASHSWTYGTGLLNKSYHCSTTVNSGNPRVWSSYNNSNAQVYNITNSTNFSISLWIKITNTSADLMQPLVFYNSAVFNMGLIFWGASYTPPGEVQGSVTIGLETLNLPAYNVDMRDNSWHQYVITYNGTIGKLYVDSTERISEAMSSPGSGDIMRIAASGNTSDSWVLNGHMDLLYIYNKTLTTTEIAQLYNSGLGV